MSDSLNRLVDFAFNKGDINSASASSRNQTWTLDQVGNWRQFLARQDSATVLDQARANNKANEITSTTEAPGEAKWAQPAYDARGNMKLAPRPGDESDANDALVCVYDAWNRLVKVYDDDDADGQPDANELIATYSYDGTNRRIRKVVEGAPDVMYDYYYSGWRVLEVRKDGSANPYEQYVWGLRYVHSPVLRWADHDTDGQNIETLYYCNDANFNVTALVQTDGTVSERYVYDPYGKVTIYNSDWSATVAWADSRKNPILYTGHRWDNETGLFYCCRRYYHPTLGRWLQRDRGYWDGMSLYEYVRSKPSGQVDPLGLWTAPLLYNKEATDIPLISAGAYWGFGGDVSGGLLIERWDCCDFPGASIIEDGYWRFTLSLNIHAGLGAGAKVGIWKLKGDLLWKWIRLEGEFHGIWESPRCGIAPAVIILDESIGIDIGMSIGVGALGQSVKPFADIEGKIFTRFRYDSHVGKGNVSAGFRGKVDAGLTLHWFLARTKTLRPEGIPQGGEPAEWKFIDIDFTGPSTPAGMSGGTGPGIGPWRKPY